MNFSSTIVDMKEKDISEKCEEYLSCNTSAKQFIRGYIIKFFGFDPETKKPDYKAISEENFEKFILKLRQIFAEKKFKNIEFENGTGDFVLIDILGQFVCELENLDKPALADLRKVVALECTEEDNKFYNVFNKLLTNIFGEEKMREKKPEIAENMEIYAQAVPIEAFLAAAQANENPVDTTEEAVESTNENAVEVAETGEVVAQNTEAVAENVADETENVAQAPEVSENENVEALVAANEENEETATEPEMEIVPDDEIYSSIFNFSEIEKKNINGRSSKLCILYIHIFINYVLSTPDYKPDSLQLCSDFVNGFECGNEILEKGLDFYRKKAGFSQFSEDYLLDMVLFYAIYRITNSEELR